MTFILVRLTLSTISRVLSRRIARFSNAGHCSSMESAALKMMPALDLSAATR